MAMETARTIGCTQIIFVPAQRSPHKMREGQEPTAGEHRFTMMLLAIRDFTNRADHASAAPSHTFASTSAPTLPLSVSDYELRRPPPSYTVDTLEALHEAAGPETTVRLLLGADQALAFNRWRRPERVLALATPAVLLRAPYRTWEDLAAAGLDARWRDWLVPGIDLDWVSATALRARIAQEVWGEEAADTPGQAQGATASRAKDCPVSEPLDALLAPAVLAYIRAHNLYRSGRGR